MGFETPLQIAIVLVAAPAGFRLRAFCLFVGSDAPEKNSDELVKASVRLVPCTTFPPFAWRFGGSSELMKSGAYANGG